MIKHSDPARAKNNYLSFAWCDKMRDDDKTWQEAKDGITQKSHSVGSEVTGRRI